MTDQVIGSQRAARPTITALIVTTAVVAVVLALSSVVTLVAQHDRLRVLSDRVAPALAANRQALQAMTDAEAAVQGFRLTQDPTFLPPYELARGQLTDHLAELTTLTAGTELADDAAAEVTSISAWTTTYAEPVVGGAAPSGPTLRAARTASDRFAATNAAVSADLTATAADLTRRSELTTWLVVPLLLALTVLGTAVAVVRGRRATRAIGPPLEALRSVVTARRAGVASARADASAGVVEIRAVAAAVNELIAATERQRSRLTDDLGLAEALQEVGQTFRESLDLGEIVDRSVRPLTVGFGASVAWVRTFEGEGELPDQGRGARFPSHFNTLPTPAATAAARRTAIAAWEAHQAVVISPDRPSVAGLSSTEDGVAMLAFVARLGADALVLAPIGVGTECLGYVIMIRGADRPRWTTAETDGALRVGRDLGRAVVHARLFEREQQLVAQMRALDARKNEFVSTVSHELRTPLASIMGHLELVRSGELGDLTDDVASSLTAVDRNSRRLAVLIEDLLLLSRVEEGVQPTKLRHLDLDAVAREVATSHQPVADRNRVTLRYSSVGPTPVQGDHAELERVISNLVTNAIKFSASGSAVEIALDHTGPSLSLGPNQGPGRGPGSAVLRVVDHGLGISGPDQEQLFTRFFRSSNPAAHAVPGTGLGLAISKLIVEKHRGSIEVESRAGVGSTFTVVLALDRSPLDATISPPGPAAPPRGRSRNLKGALT